MYVKPFHHIQHSLNSISKKTCTKPTVHKFNISLSPQFYPSMPPLNDNARHKIQNVVAAIKVLEADHWWAAMKPEIESINEKVTCILVPCPNHCQLITRKWLLRCKLNPNQLEQNKVSCLWLQSSRTY